MQQYSLLYISSMTELLDYAFNTYPENQDSSTKIKTIFKNMFSNIIFPLSHPQTLRSKNLICICIIQNQENLPGKYFIQVSDMTSSLKFDFSFLSQKGQPIRIKSQYQKCSLMKKFTKNNQSQALGSWQINPLNGQVHFVISTFISFNQKKLQNFESKVEETLTNVKKGFFSHRQAIKLIYHYHKVFQSEVNSKNFQNSYQEKQSLLQGSHNSAKTSSIAQFLKYCTKQFEFSKLFKSKNLEQKQQKNQQNEEQQREQQYFQEKQYQNIQKAQKRTIIKDLEQHFIQDKNNNLELQVNKHTYGDFKKRAFAKSINEYMQLLETSFLKPVTSHMKNYQKLMLTKKNQQELSSEIGSMKIRRKSSAIIKVKDQIFGNLRLQVKQSGYQMANKINSYMRGLPIHGKQVCFFDNYFKFQQKFAEGFTLTLALNKQNAKKFLQVNSNCMSFQTKMKIFSQIISCSYLLWKKLDTIIPNISISAFSVTKSIGVKLDSLHSLTYLKKYDKQEKLDRKRQIELKLVESNLNIARIFLTIFYDYHVMYFRSNYKSQKSLQFLKQSNRFSKIMTQKIQNNIQIFGPYQQMKNLLYQVMEIIAEPQKDWNSMKNHDIKWMICGIIKILQQAT